MSSGPHIAERTSLFVLIALGEGLLVTGLAFVDTESSPDAIVAMAAAFVAAAATWWIYFDHGERIGSETIEASDQPARLARTAYTWIHLAIVGGIVLLSVGDEHPRRVVSVLGGPAPVPRRRVLAGTSSTSLRHGPSLRHRAVGGLAISRCWSLARGRGDASRGVDRARRRLDGSGPSRGG